MRPTTYSFVRQRQRPENEQDRFDYSGKIKPTANITIIFKIFRENHLLNSEKTTEVHCGPRSNKSRCFLSLYSTLTFMQEGKCKFVLRRDERRSIRSIRA